MKTLALLAAMYGAMATPAFAEGQKVVQTDKGPIIVTDLGSGIYGDNNGNYFARDQPGIIVDLKTGQRTLIQGSDLEHKLDDMNVKPTTEAPNPYKIYETLSYQGGDAYEHQDYDGAMNKIKAAIEIFKSNRKVLLSQAQNPAYFLHSIGRSYGLLSSIYEIKQDIDSAIKYREMAVQYLEGDDSQQNADKEKLEALKVAKSKKKR